MGVFAQVPGDPVMVADDFIPLRWSACMTSHHSSLVSFLGLTCDRILSTSKSDAPGTESSPALFRALTTKSRESELFRETWTNSAGEKECR